MPPNPAQVRPSEASSPALLSRLFWGCQRFGSTFGLLTSCVGSFSALSSVHHCCDHRTLHVTLERELQGTAHIWQISVLVTSFLGAFLKGFLFWTILHI